MWYPLNSNPPHTALHLSVKDVPPRILNRAVDGLLNRKSTTYNLEPPFLGLASATPCHFGPNVDFRKAKVAFGKWAIPKLRRELHSDKPDVVHHAVSTLMDLVHDPKKCYEIINSDVIIRVADLLCSDDNALKQKCLSMLATVAGLSLGREAITKCRIAMDALAELVRDSDVGVRHETALTLEMLSRSVFGAEALNEHKFMQFILSNLLLEDDVVVAVHLVTLEALLEAGAAIKQVAIDMGAAQALHLMIGSSCDPIVARVLTNMALLLENQEGKRYAESVDLMALLAKKLNHKNKQVYTRAAAALMHLTTSTPSKLRAVQLNLLPRLLKMSVRLREPALQVCCIKTMTNIAEVPSIRQLLMEKHQTDIEAIDCAECPFVSRHRDILLGAMRWKP